MTVTRRHLLLTLIFSFICLTELVKAQCTPTITSIQNCNGRNSYQIVIPPCPATPPFHLVWTTFGCANPTLITVPTPGTYTVGFTADCPFGYALSIYAGSAPPTGTFVGGTSGPPVLLSAAAVLQPLVSFEPSCFGDCNGSMTANWIVPIGGSPLSMTLDPGVGQTTFSNVPAFVPQTYTALCAGVHAFNVVNNAGCATNNVTFAITQPSVISSNTAVAQPVCNGDSNGSFSVAPTGGNGALGGYTVTFSNGQVLTTGVGGTVVATGLPVGPVTATVVDSKACTYTVSTIIGQPTAIAITPTQTNLVCNTVCNGAASVAVTGGGGTYTYNWSPNAGSLAGISGLCATVIHTVTITDNNGCVRTSTFLLTQPPAVTLTPTSTNVVCSGSCTGEASITASGGTGAFSYTWVAPGPVTLPGSVPSRVNLCSFTTPYTITVLDANLCTSPPVFIIITQPPAITVTAASNNISCFGANDGSGTVTPSGGNGGPFTYSWVPGSMITPVVTGLGPNTYTAIVRDASLCPTQTFITIVEPSGLIPTVTHTDLACNVANRPCDGVINASPLGGTPPYFYTLTTVGSTITSAPPYTGLCAGNYTVRVRDGSGCPQQSVVALSQPGPITPSIITTSVTCFGNNTGGLTGDPGTGGNGSYTLTWATPLGPLSGGALTNQPAGNYTFFVVDSKTCTAQATATVTQPSSITVNVNTSNITCFSACNGVLTATVSGGSAPYTYTWTNSSSVVVSNTLTASGLCPGSYTLLIRDNNACTRTVVASVTSPPPITLTAVTNPVNCFGDSNGSATVTAGGGTPSFTYQFNSAPTVSNTSGILTGQPSGTYIATITDLAGCVSTTAFAIASPTALAASLTGTGSCNACTGNATVSPSFGTGPYTYSWSSSIGPVGAVTPTLSNLCAGVYTATVTDSKTCSVVRTITLTQLITVTVSLGGTSILCNGASTGSATALASGGTGIYSYSWTPSGQTQSVISGVGANTYTVRVTDTSIPSTCSHTAAITLTEPSAIGVTLTPTNATCFGFSDGAAASTVTGGIAPYSYTWNPGGQSTPSVTGIPAGTYTLNVRDNNLCTLSRTVLVTQSPSISIALTITDPTGCSLSQANGSICAVPSGGSGSGYTYTLSPLGTTNTTGCFTSLGGGAYSIIVRDGLGCSNSTVTTLSPPLGPTISVNSVSVACFGYSTGIASATVTGVSPFTWTWTPASSSVVVAATTTASGLPAGIYIVTASDNNSCTATRAITVTEAPAYTLNPVSSNLRCNGLTTGSIIVSPSGGSPVYTYTWQPPLTVTISGQGTPILTGLAAGVYTLNLSDTHTCVTPYTFTITQPPAITLTAITHSLLCFNVCTGSIVANASGGAGAISYSWTPVGGSSPTITNLCANSGTNPVAYTLTATDANTCIATNTYVIIQPPLLTNTVNVVNPSCSNSCNAVATQTASGGTPGYNYSWSSSTLTTAGLGSLCAGTYSSYVTDANGCLSERSYSVNAPTPLNVTLTPSNPLCNAACDGSIATLISGSQGAVSYAWLPSGTGQNPTGLCAIAPGPQYTLVATDASLCAVTAVTTLTNPPAIVASITSTNPICHNDANGLASVSVINQIGATTYTWLPPSVPPQTAPTATGLVAGHYTVQVRDANNCQASQTFSLTNPSTITINTSVNPATCLQPNGGITANPSGGTPGTLTPYTYSWTGVVSSASVVSNLLAGPYTVTVNDALGCTASVNILLSNSNGPNLIPVSSTSNICNKQCAGTASVDITGIMGGTPSYTVSWLAPAPSTGNPASGLCAGLYNAQIEDATGCLGFTTVTIAEPPTLIMGANVTLPLCPGICDGGVTLNPTGGNSPYTYSWTTGSTSASLTGLCAGDYSLTVGYNGVCSVDTVFRIPDQSSITIVPTVTNNTCFGTCIGVVNLSITGGASPYVAGWSNGQTGVSQASLCNGTYTVIVTDNNGCGNTATASVISGPPMTTSTSAVSPSCGACDGSASVTATGGMAPLTYSWSNSATTPSVGNLCAGIYVVQITDALSCAQAHTLIMNSANGITGENINIKQIPCSGTCDGSATVTAIGGTAPIGYSWLSTPPVTNSVITNLCPGTHFIQMMDAMSCIRVASVVINPVVTLSVSPFVFLPACGNSNGSISISIAGGTPSYNIVWNPPAPGGATTAVVGLNSGVFSYTVTESSTNSCSISNTINLSNANGPVINPIQHNMDCFGICSGSISAISTSTSTPLTYAWSNGSVTPSVNGLCRGVITLTLTDVNLCKTFRTFTITDNPELQLGLPTLQQPTCFGDCDGSIQLVPSGGVAPYTYTWTVENRTANPIVALCDGTYSASVFDSKGCEVKSDSYLIKSASSMSFALNTFSSSCTAVADGSVTLVVSGGTPEYSYLWNGPSNYTATSQNISNLFSGTYSVSVSDNLGCDRQSTLAIVPNLTVVAQAGADNVICPGTGSVLLSAGVTSGENYKWFSPANRVTPLGTGPTLLIKNLEEPSAYILVATSTVPSCYAEDTVIVNLHVLPPVDAGRNFKIPVYSTVTIGGRPSNWGAASLTWTPAMYLNDASSANPVASNTIDVTFKLTVTDVNGCIASDSVMVELYPELNITTGFTPNGDGKNDYWVIDYIDQFPATTIDIFNRWGDQVFSSTGYDTPFDGKYKGADLPVGTYYYIIKLNHPGYPKPITGPLTIFR